MRRCVSGFLFTFDIHHQVCVLRIWSLVRHIAGMLKKKVDDLSQVSQ